MATYKGRVLKVRKVPAKSGMKSAILRVDAQDILERASGLPDMADVFVDWLLEWRGDGASLENKLHAVEVNTPVWRLIVLNSADTVLDYPSNYPTKTKHEWLFDGSTAYQNGDVVFVPLPQIEPYDNMGDPCTVVGFFVAASRLYFPETRKGSVARTGKDIDREVKFAKSKGGGEWTVLVYKDGTKSCNCPSWIFHHDATHGCKHTDKV